MFRYFLKPLLTNHKSKHCTLTIFRFIEAQSASNKTNLTDKQSLTVSYLTDSCGLSLQSAISASSFVDIKNIERSNSVLELFRSHGFSQNDISTLISKYPNLILADPVTNLRPKLEFFESLGIVGPEFPGIVISCAIMFRRSLDKCIKPTFDFLKCFADVNKNSVHFFKVLTRVYPNFKKCIVPNVKTLRDHNMLNSQIGKFIMQNPRSFTAKPDTFKEVVNAVTEMGIDPNGRKFISAVSSMTAISKPTWDRKKEVLLSLGWTESDFDLAFNLQPMLMFTSEKKMREVMNFLVEKVGVKASDVARYPNVFLTSLEKRLIPRWSLVQALKSKGLIDQNIQVFPMFVISKPVFEAKYVMKYKDEVPEVINVYKVVNAVTEMGIDPNGRKFITAVSSMTAISKARWDRKKEALLSLGWSESDFDLAFNLQPMLMFTSEKKMREVMNFLVEKVGVKASDVARYPNVFLTSLEKRLIPRWSLVQALKSKGLIDQNIRVFPMFVISKPVFEAKYVMKYKDEVPEVINVYKSGGIALN